MTSDSQDPQTTASETPETSSVPPEETTEEAATETDTSAPSFGWNAYAERINGRFAMVGFVALLVLELITRQDFFTWLGF
ncbi:MAG: chlorophyll A-B-binding protein [Leptolyngbya sp. SIOISBB]|nr:chlorophyll A-B-binding protein [Leptolyngbya sp. SIOISBB]